MIRIISVVIALSFAHQAASQTNFYQCKDKWGQPVFSQRPCGSDAEQHSVTPHSQISTPSRDQPVATAPGESPAAEAETFSIEVTRTKRRLSEIDEDLDRREARIARYSDERDAKIAILKDKRRYANNNLAGATWQESLASEMQAIATQYDTKINSQQQKIDDLQEESRLLKDKLASS